MVRTSLLTHGRRPSLRVLEPGFLIFWHRQSRIYEIDGMGDSAESGINDPRWLLSVGKLKEGISLQRAQAAMNVKAFHLAQLFPDAYKGMGVKVEPCRRAFSVAGCRCIDTVRDRCIGPADCMRKRCQPAAGSCGCTPKRNWRTRCVRSKPSEFDTSVAHRKRLTFADRRSNRPFVHF